MPDPGAMEEANRQGTSLAPNKSLESQAHKVPFATFHKSLPELLDIESGISNVREKTDKFNMCLQFA